MLSGCVLRNEHFIACLLEPNFSFLRLLEPHVGALCFSRSLFLSFGAFVFFLLFGNPFLWERICGCRCVLESHSGCWGRLGQFLGGLSKKHDAKAHCFNCMIWDALVLSKQYCRMIFHISSDFREYPLRFAQKLVSLDASLKQTCRGQPALPDLLPVAISSLNSMEYGVDSELWQCARLSEVFVYIRGGKHLRVPESWAPHIPKAFSGMF